MYGTWLESYGNSEVEVIRALRPFVPSLDLKEVKHLVESAPCYVLEHVTHEDAQACADALNAAGATAYVKEMDGKLLPYEYSFENEDLEGEGWSLVDCDTYSGILESFSFGYSGDCYFLFSSSTNPPQYLISPELVAGKRIRATFWYRAYSSDYSETFQVGYSTTTNDVSAFTWGEEITANEAMFIQYINTFPAGTKYVAVRCNFNDTQGAVLYLDTFKFYEIPAPKTLPYEYGFENEDLYEEGWSLVDCDKKTNISDLYNNIYSGVNGFMFWYNTNPPQYLISPELVGSGKMKVSFWYCNRDASYPETFQVGYSTTTNDVGAFTWGDEITASDTQWTKFQNTFPAGTKYVAVRYNSNDQFELLLDDFSFTGGLKGDVNSDGSVDISDVVLMVNYILGNDSSANVLQNGDMNDDQRVDISDVVAIVNIILGNN